MKVFLLNDYPNLTSGQEYECVYMDDKKYYIVNEVDSNVRRINKKDGEITDDTKVSKFKMVKHYDSGLATSIGDVVFFNEKIIITMFIPQDNSLPTFYYHKMDEHEPDYTESNINVLNTLNII